MASTGEAPPLEIEGNGPNQNGSHCTRCGAKFECGMKGPEPCWCAAYPHVLPLPAEDAGCYCPACLAELTARLRTKIGAPPT